MLAQRALLTLLTDFPIATEIVDEIVAIEPTLGEEMVVVIEVGARLRDIKAIADLALLIDPPLLVAIHLPAAVHLHAMAARLRLVTMTILQRKGGTMIIIEVGHRDREDREVLAQ